MSVALTGADYQFPTRGAETMPSRKSFKSSQRKLNRKSRALTQLQHNERIKCLDAANLYRQGKAKSVSGAARLAGTSLKEMRRLIPRAIVKDPKTGRLRITKSDRYSQKVEIVTDAGAIVVTARGSRQRQLAGQHRATYMAVAENKQPASDLQKFSGKKVGGHVLLRRLRAPQNIREGWCSRAA